MWKSIAVALIIVALLAAVIMLMKPRVKKGVGYKPPLTNAEKIRVMRGVSQRLSGVDDEERRPTLEEIIDGILDALKMNDNPHQRTRALLADFAEVIDLGWGNEGAGDDPIGAVEQWSYGKTNAALRQAVLDLIAHLEQKEDPHRD